MTEYTIHKVAMMPDDDKGLSDAELEKAADAIGKLMNKEFERLMGFPFPPLPTTIEIKPRCCSGVVLHAPNCKYWGVAT